jgi:hypothetical protein
MSNIKSLIRKLHSVPINTPILKPVYKEMLDSYCGDFSLIINDKINIDKKSNGIIIREPIYSSQYNNSNWTLSINIIPPNNEINNLSPEHIKLLSGKLYCKSDLESFNLKKGTITINKKHDFYNKNNEDVIFLSFHEKNIYSDIPLL